VHDRSADLTCWSHQFGAPLTNEFRVLGLDLCGDDELAQLDSRTRADTLATAIEERQIDRPVIVAWSGSADAVAEYLSVHGQERVAGIGLVDWAPIEAADAVLRDLRLPVLLSYCADDGTSRSASAEHILARCPTARASIYEGLSRPPFVADPVRFNLELADFTARANRDRLVRA
jgi:pimeloyl-ACP methyl ester carboxylesterase